MQSRNGVQYAPYLSVVLYWTPERAATAWVTHRKMKDGEVAEHENPDFRPSSLSELSSSESREDHIDHISGGRKLRARADTRKCPLRAHPPALVLPFRRRELFKSSKITSPIASLRLVEPSQWKPDVQHGEWYKRSRVWSGARLSNKRKVNLRGQRCWRSDIFICKVFESVI